jgi:mono/diheme cytochrome c family protein
MQVLLVLVPFLALGVAVIFVAFSGGPAAAREAYLTRGRRAFPITVLVLYVGAGIAVPAAVIAARPQAVGGVGHLRAERLSGPEREGKRLFVQTCKSCHTLAAVQAHGVTGPDLDQLAPLDRQRVLHAIKIGGTGDGRMPPGLYSGSDAQDVAAYVSKVAGH